MRHAATLMWAASLACGVATVAQAQVSFAAQDKIQMNEKRVDAANAPSYKNIREYISTGWDHLTRSLDDCKTYQDLKTSGEPTLYLPAGFPQPPAIGHLLQEKCQVDIETLPAAINPHGELDNTDIKPEGLLYLPHPYVVPGGQFNEMYGWDSYFIIRGLLADGRVELAKGMVENFFFEIEHYGAILNANRTYYLTRSQPPFLTSMILAVYEAERAAGKDDRDWLRRAYEFAVRDHTQWTNAPHLAGDTGLSRYFDHGEGPVPEIIGNPDSYYGAVAQFFALHDGADEKYLAHPGAGTKTIGALFTISRSCEQPAAAPNQQADNCTKSEQVALSPEYYKGDRSMRESGFDVSFRFGPFSADTHHYAPVCLNSLLYKTEKDLAQISTLLGKPQDANRWESQAGQRERAIDKYLWDEKRGQYFDYDFTTNARSTYEYATTFYPLWAGLASKAQAATVMKNLKKFEQPGGIVMSGFESQAQWDYPYGWAPIHVLACEGMRRYAFNADADRLSYKFLEMVLQNFYRDRTIREKYDVVTRTSVTHIVEGYAENVIGFGWTNAAFIVLAAQLPPEGRRNLESEAPARN
jgi:alpha,alpha-trehalase